MLRHKKALIALGLALVGALLYLGFWGPLFAWMPVQPGWTALTFPRARIVTRGPSRLDPAYQQVERLMTEAEGLYQLKYRRPVEVIVSDSNWRHRLFMPVMHTPAFCLETGDVVYINARNLRERKRDMASYLQHELCHALLYQNTSFLKAWTMNGQHWVTEGTAVNLAGPRYLTRQEFVARFSAIDPAPAAGTTQLFAFPEDPGPGFNYTLYGYFIQYLIETGGRDKFAAFLKDYIADPDRLLPIFQRHYGLSLADAAKGFKAEIRDSHQLNPNGIPWALYRIDLIGDCPKFPD